MQDFTIYHNPRCSKSRQALSLLQQHQIEPTIIDYRKQPPSVGQLKQLLQLAQLKVKDIIRTKEDLYSTLKLNQSTPSDDELLAILCQHPILIERPIVYTKNRAIIARPAEKVLELIQ